MNDSRALVPREISENEAGGEIKALYEDIRSVLGTGIVPLVFRLLAAIPGVLPWCWHTIRPLYTSGEVLNAGKHLIERVPSPPLRPLPVCVFDTLGISKDARETILITLDHFNHSNPMNLISLSTLLKAIEEEPQPSKIDPPAPPSPVKHATIKPPHDQPLLSMLTIDEMEDATILLIYALQKIGLPIDTRPDSRKITRPTQAMASVWRILARWPAYLALSITILQTQEANGWIAVAREAVLENADSQTNILLERVKIPTNIPLPQDHSVEQMKGVIKRFTGAGLIRIIPVVSALKRTLPE